MPKLTELKKALLTTTGDGAALVPYDLDPYLHEELMNLQPLVSILDFETAEGKTHEYNVRTSHPQSWFEGESTPMNQKTGATARKTVQLKIQRIWGGVTGFAQAVDEKFIDALAEELTSSLEGMADIFEYGVMWGCANDIGFTGDAYQYSGMIPRMLAYAPGNVIDAGGNKVVLADLDAAKAKIAKFRQTRNDPSLAIMGLQMKQVVDGLQTKVSLPLQSVELADGKIVMAAYGGTPLLESDYVVPLDTTPSPTAIDTLAAGGTLADATYTYRISSVTAVGEQVAGTASAGEATSGGNNSVDVTWTADATALLYMIWRKTSGNYSLVDIIPALTYDGAGTVNGTIETYTDSGAKALITVKPLEDGEQNILYLNREARRGASFIGKIDESGSPLANMVQYTELAKIKDTYDFMLKSYIATKLVHPNLVSLIRNVKLA